MTKIKSIGVLTSGGDAPGMNAAIRAVVRTAIFNNLKVYGIYSGYEGLIDAKIKEMTTKDVSNIIQRGGTILGSARSDRFRTEDGRKQAYDNLKDYKIDAMVVIGGDGTFTGAGIFSKEFDIPTVGIPGTIDNDLFGTDHTIGYDTALNTVVEAVDRIKDTASSHGRLFLVEVMGRNAGFIALTCGIACGAEAILIPEQKTTFVQLVEYLNDRFAKKKSSGIVIVAEGDESGGAYKIAEKLKSASGEQFDIRVSVLGHLQRGGSPSAFDRFLASRLGVEAVEALLENQRSIMVGMANQQIVHVSFSKTIKLHNMVDPKLMQVADILNI